MREPHVSISVEEYHRLKLIENSARNLHFVFADLLTSDPAGLVNLKVDNDYVGGIITQAMTELAVMIGETDDSPFKKDKSQLRLPGPPREPA